MAKQSLLFVGSVNRTTDYSDTARGEGLTVYLFDEETGEALRQSVFKGIDNPTFISIEPRRHLLFANSEVYGWNEGVVSALRFDPQTGELRYLNKQPTLGSIAAHNGVDRSGNYLFVANYHHEPRWGGYFGEDVPGQAVAVFPIDERGWIGAPCSSVAHVGRGTDPERQNEPHPHCTMTSPDNRFVLVADLGINHVVTYRFGAGKLTHSSAFDLPPGSGPRHLKFAPDGRSVYVINEVSSTVAHLGYDAATGRLSLRQVISTLPDGFSAWNNCSELQISPDGRFLYAANRGHDSIALFRIDPRDGSLAALGRVPCGGKIPRNIGLTPSAGHLLVANQDSDRIAVFGRDPQAGTLTLVGAIEVGTPMVVAMIPR
ncbi:MAG: lactonase family protein [Ancalomicrobiaceae bacterium]|nr:lactonase family protein [Ancalomicrobiaceae bacterium]